MLTVNGLLYAFVVDDAPAVGIVPFVVYIVVNPVSVGNVTVTSLFVQPVGLAVAFSTALIVPVVTLKV